MKTVPFILLLATLILSSGCVSRTTTLEPQHRGGTPSDKKNYGSDPHSKLLEKKTIWIWQDEFRTPK